MKEIYKQLYDEYKNNEEINAHAENFCLLANAFGSKVEQRLARINLQRRNRKGYVCPRTSFRCYTVVNPYYKTLIEKE